MKMNKIVIIVCLILSVRLTGQVIQPCRNSDFNPTRTISDPAYNQRRSELIEFTKEFTGQYRNKLQPRNSDSIKYIIPIVFHIMHNNGPENISDEKILDAVKLLNKDYQKQNADTSSVVSGFLDRIGNARIEFRLARLDPAGHCTNGITRHTTILTNNGQDLLKQIIRWPPDKYLNIWVTKSIYDGYGQYFGYTFPPGIDANLDGVLVDYRIVGNVGIRTLPHEIGHYLNLEHTFGNGNFTGVLSNCDSSDFVDDTPPTTGSNSNCDLNLQKCIPGQLENVQNIMDYSSCPIMYTYGQTIRMQAALNSTVGNRNNLWATSNLILTGTIDGYQTMDCSPVADFSDKHLVICIGDNIQLINSSYGSIIKSSVWNIDGKDKKTINSTNAIFTLDSSGIYNISLTVSNEFGTHTLTRKGLIEVLPNKIAGDNITQGFESLQYPSDGWNDDNNAGLAWQVTDIASYNGKKSMLLPYDILYGGNSEDVLYTEVVDLSQVPSPIFNFKIAFSAPDNSQDIMKIFGSRDCGKSWQLRYFKSSSDLRTAAANTGFIPKHSEWRQENVNITPFAGESWVRFKFVFNSNQGDNLFIDDINISGLLTPTRSELLKEVSVTISPNPTNQDPLIFINLAQPKNFTVRLIDMFSKIIYEDKIRKMEVGDHTIRLPKPISTGIYIVDIEIDRSHICKKMIIF
jgi:PKD repeat protein